MEILPNWPESLGDPLNSGYKHTLETIDSVAMTAGIDRARRVLADPVSEFSVSFHWNPDQLQQFRQFARQQIDGTAGWFVMPLWSGGGMEPHTVRIKKSNKYQLKQPDWSVSFVLECPDRYRLPDEIGDVLLEWNILDLITAGKIAEGSLCTVGSTTECLGGWNVFDIATLTEQSQCNLSEFFKDWDNC